MTSPATSDYTWLFVFVTGVTTIIYLGARKMFGGGNHDPREPPLATQSIPIIGHMVGMARSKFNYYVDISKQTDAPIVTMSLPGKKMYIVTKPELIQAVQKLPRVLAFPPIEAKFATTICGSSPEAQAILAKNVNGDEGATTGLSMESYEGMRAALKPGPDLDDMNRTMLREIVTSLDQLDSGRNNTFGLYTWLREAITSATTRSVYGPMSPYEDKSIADSFWEFENGLMAILIGVLPSLTARKPIAARDRVVKAFEKYYGTPGGIDKASVFAKNRYQAQVRNGVPPGDIARFEVGGSVALLVNTAPAAFWTLFFVYAVPGLLDQIRAEIDACVETNTFPEHVVKTINISKLKKECPLLLSSYQETLRHRSMGTSVREVMQDTILDGRWLLKRGAMLQMPSRVIHLDSGLWGSDVADFKPRSFLAEEKKNRPGNVCFRAFGGGETLCPGRHFATNEVLAVQVVALFVARFDMVPAGDSDGGDTDKCMWKLPTTANTNVAAVVMTPDDDVEVRITPRQSGTSVDVEPGKMVKWAVSLDGSDKIFAMVSEDIIVGGETE